MAWVCSSCRATFDATARSGICPQCRQGVLTASGRETYQSLAGPGGGAATAGAARTTSRPGGGGARSLILVVAGLASFVAAFIWVPVLLDRWRHPSVSAAGAYEVENLGMTIAFGAGWRHLTDQDVEEEIPADAFMEGVPLTAEQREAAREMIGTSVMRMSLFFKGGRSQNPDFALMVGTLEVETEMFHQAILDDFEGAVRSGAKNAVASMKQMRMEGTLGRCEEIRVGAAGAWRCRGAAQWDGLRKLCIYMWPSSGGFGMALMVTRDEDPCDVLDDIVGSMKPTSS